jgi:hypothetical protein
MPTKGCFAPDAAILALAIANAAIGVATQQQQLKPTISFAMTRYLDIIEEHFYARNVSQSEYRLIVVAAV